MSFFFLEQCYLWPRCKACKGLLRPHVVWFGEGLEEEILGKKAVFRIWDPDPVLYLNAAPDPGSQTIVDPDLDPDLALLSHENFNFVFLLYVNQVICLETLLGN